MWLLHDGQADEHIIKLTRLWNKQQDTIPRFYGMGVQVFIKHDVNAGRTGVTGCPSFLPTIRNNTMTCGVEPHCMSQGFHHGCIMLQ